MLNIQLNFEELVQSTRIYTRN